MISLNQERKYQPLKINLRKCKGQEEVANSDFFSFSAPTFALGGKGVIYIVNFLPVWKHSGNSSTKNTDQMR